MSKVKVDKIVLDINGKKLELSLADAQGLRDALDEVLGKETVVTIREPYPYTVTVPYVYTYPRWYGNITYGNNIDTGGTYTISNNGNTASLS